MTISPKLSSLPDFVLFNPVCTECRTYAYAPDDEEEVGFAAERRSSSSRPPLPPSTSSLDAEQTQCSLSEITRLINANKQTTALRQPQMKADLYPINKRRRSFNLPVSGTLPQHSSFTSTHPPTPPSLLPISALAVLLGWAQRQGKPTDSSIIHRSALPSPLLCFPSFPRILGPGKPSRRRALERSFGALGNKRRKRRLLSVPLTHLLFPLHSKKRSKMASSFLSHAGAYACASSLCLLLFGSLTFS